MPLVAWSDDYCTGDAAIDRQHQDLFTMVNALHDAVVAGRGRDELSATLERLGNYVSAHFQTEERFMQQHAYPDYAAHKAKHDELGQRAAKVIDDYRSGRAVLTIALSRFLAEWLRHHIDGDDKAMIAFFQNRVQVGS
jgi:hemerythrin